MLAFHLLIATLQCQAVLVLSSELFPDPSVGSVIISVQSMGPYGAHHAPESIQFSCLSCTSSFVSGSKSVWRACAQVWDSFSVFKSCRELDCSKLKVKSKTGEAKRSSLVFQWTKLLKLLPKGIFCSFATTRRYYARGVVRDRALMRTTTR